MRNSKGFTMIELLAVLVIIMAIAAFSMATVLSNSRRFQAAEAIEKLGYIRRELLRIGQLGEYSGGSFDFTNGGNIGTGHVMNQMNISMDFLDGDHYKAQDYEFISISSTYFAIQVGKKVKMKDPPVVVMTSWDTGSPTITIDQPID